ncbi:hypothetical protein CULCOIPH002_09540 [Corynebacterium ulcerans]|uniref:Uncharacterized protein n=1 Tax=Corynebacterium ulcerans TaxID=65058 RepID=A0ABD0BEW3_CORUL|nr:hypothetical protein CULC0102_0182 [Corynebacterium ulcerans 0102]BBJ71042.1 hypothetical protein CULC0211_01760 [Corynebacterium ulcerans]BBJ73350.1 hypothetical protein CULCFH20161_01770 [Corynebacterium ulcerans]BDV24924.1 hypothetical protein CULTSU28_01720 [Corynebacterium ulcerans]GJJ36042.1 hypothetical protein CULCOIPH002_09540 [Corynebacterium ulcerans]
MNEEQAAEEWWDCLPSKRKTQIWKWIVSPSGETPQIPGQMELLEKIEEKQ